MPTLDPAHWPSLRTQAHKMLDDILDYVENVRERPVWQPIPQQVRDRFRSELPQKPTELAGVHDEFTRHILPYATGNVHPGFMGWVHGGGNVAGLLAEMLAAGLNANLGGRDHVPIEVEQQVVHWMRSLFGFPQEASGLFVTGSSMANLLAVLIARTGRLGAGVRRRGVAAAERRLTAYVSTAAHRCIAQAMDLSGLGTDALRLIPIDERFEIDIGALKARIAADRQAGLLPFLLIGTAGTVDTGAIDDLKALAHTAAEEELWFHVDGAIGAVGMLAPEIAPQFAGIERADSIALDFHKWLQVPYDAGFILVRDGALHRNTFSSPEAYLRRETRGLAAGAHWPCDFGPDLSRGFRALKTWFTFKVYGTDALGAMIAHSCALARYLEIKINTAREFELLAPVALNIVCFRYRCEDADRVNATIVADLHESGIAAPSTTTLDGKLAIRVALCNHRTEMRDIDAMLSAAASFGARAATAAKNVA
ncbi:MAG TPA: pyridoxal-dependent decarboxylase [Pseudolabrys sp.]|nr:pyridoxal-dependent decarboxylase [Pseudolabrys sp.]